MVLRMIRILSVSFCAFYSSMDASSEQIHTLMADPRPCPTASRDMARASPAAKDQALIALAAAIRQQRPALQDANLRDLHAARKTLD